MSDINKEQPSIASDARFIGGRELVKNGSDDAIEMFALLLKECKHKYGDSNIETAPCYYEYGNALFRAANRRLMDDYTNKSPEKIKEDTKHSSSDKKVLVATTSSSRNKLHSKNDEKDDIQLALELMENAWSILDQYQNTKPIKQWVQNQIPRYLIGIGEVLSVLKRHADSADVYTRALPYREMPIKNASKDDKSIEHLRNRRLCAEVNVLIAEELLLCDEDEDVVTVETGSVLVKKEERVEFITGYYQKARDELQEIGEFFFSGRGNIHELSSLFDGTDSW